MYIIWKQEMEIFLLALRLGNPLEQCFIITKQLKLYQLYQIKKIIEKTLKNS